MGFMCYFLLSIFNNIFDWENVRSKSYVLNFSYICINSKKQPAPFRVPGLKLYCYHYISIKKGGDKNATCNPQLAIDFPNTK